MDDFIIQRADLEAPNCFYNKDVEDISYANLTFQTYTNLATTLEGYGNALSKPHKDALMELSDTYTKIIKGDLQGRFAFGLDTGMGKTSSVTALCKALYDMKADNIGILICQSKVEALCTLKKDMIASGIPEEKIGLIHSYRDVLYPSTDDKRQFQLVTHVRARSNGILQYNNWSNAERSLVIWDESLIASDSFAITQKELKKAVLCLDVDIHKNQDYSALLDYLESCLKLTEEALESLKENKSDRQYRQAFSFPKLSEAEVVAYKELLYKERQESYHSTLLELLEISNMEVRPALSNGEDGVICYEISVPKELSNIVVLDASWHIRELEKLDKTIKDISQHVKPGLKKYDHVTVTQIKGGSGRSTLTQDLSQKRLSDRKTTSKIAKVIEAIPNTEKVLIFTFKERGNLSMPRVIQRDLEDLGVNMKDASGEKRVLIETWGNETSSNSYSDCENVILVGLLYLPKLALTSAFVGQSDNLNIPITNSKISELSLSEVAHRAFQALSRGSCRRVDNGYACPMKAWVIYSGNSLESQLTQVMTNVKWIYKGEVDEDKAGITYTLTMEIIECLKSLPPSVHKLSIRRFKSSFPELNKPSAKTFSNAINKLETYSMDWSTQNRSLVRL